MRKHHGKISSESAARLRGWLKTYCGPAFLREQEQRITVLTLDGRGYRVHGEFVPGMQATSVLLPGFTVNVKARFALAQDANGVEKQA